MKKMESMDVQHFSKYVLLLLGMILNILLICFPLCHNHQIATSKILWDSMHCFHCVRTQKNLQDGFHYFFGYHPCFVCFWFQCIVTGIALSIIVNKLFVMGQGAISWTIFHCNSYSIEIWFCSHLNSFELTIMKYCTTALLSWHVQSYLVLR